MFFCGVFLLLLFIILHNKNKKFLNEYVKPTKYPTVSFIVPAYNEEDSIETTLKALLKIEYPKNKKEIIVVNDGSKDNTAGIVRKIAVLHKQIKLIDKKNSGKANSLNEAIKIARGELIAVVDADSYPEKDALMKMIGYFDDERVAAVTSRVLVKNKNNWLGRFQVLDYSIIAWTRKLLDFVDSVYVTNGPLSVYRKSVVKKLGGFDPNNLTEDIEITWHILSEGYKTRMSYSAIVYTTVPEKLSVWIKQRVRWNLGGLQTISKYRKAMFNNIENMFGYFVIPYVAASFALAVIGFLLLSRYIWKKGFYYLLSLYYSFRGYNFFEHIDLTLSITLLLIFGLSFFCMSIYYYKQGFKHSQTGNKSVFKIMAYSIFYRSLYVIPLLIALYKLARGDIRWYTK